MTFTRLKIATAAVLLSAAAAAAQIPAPYDRPAGYSPFALPSIARFAPNRFAPKRFAPNRFGRVGLGAYPYGSGYGAIYPSYYGGYGFYGPGFDGGYGIAYTDRPEDSPQAGGYAPLIGPQYLSSAVARRRAAETAAQADIRTVLTVEFPAPAAVWVNGETQPGGPATEYKLDAPDLVPGQTHTFAIRARWSAGGREYEYDRTMTLAAGDTKTLTVFTGTPVRP